MGGDIGSNITCNSAHSIAGTLLRRNRIDGDGVTLGGWGRTGRECEWHTGGRARV